MKRSIRAVTTGSGTEPISSKASWKAPSRPAPTRVHALHPKLPRTRIMHHKRLMMHRICYLSFNSLRSRGGHGFPAFNAARLASRIATICLHASASACGGWPVHRACRWRRDTYLRSFALPSFQWSPIMHHKRLMMRAKSNGNSKSVSTSRRSQPRTFSGCSPSSQPLPAHLTILAGRGTTSYGA